MTNILKYNRPINMHPINVMIFEKMIYISAKSFTGNEFFTVFQFGFLQNKKIIWDKNPPIEVKAVFRDICLKSNCM